MTDENPETSPAETPETPPAQDLEIPTAEIKTEPRENDEEEADKPGQEEKTDVKSTDTKTKLEQKPTPVSKKTVEEGDECIFLTPSGEELPDGEVEKIIIESVNILKFCRDKVDEQKIDSHSLAFMLLRIKESIEAYHKDYIPKLNTFLVNADRITSDYYARMCCSLPKYGDYLKAIEAQETDKIAAGGDDQISKMQLHGIVKNVTDNYLASAMNLKSDRAVLKDVNSTMNDRSDIVNKVLLPMPNWVGIQNNITCQLESIRQQAFKISAYIDFLKQGEAKNGPVLDLSALDLKKNVEQTIRKTDY